MAAASGNSLKRSYREDFLTRTHKTLRDHRGSRALYVARVPGMRLCTLLVAYFGHLRPGNGRKV
jgi:hypothetical protein